MGDKRKNILVVENDNGNQVLMKKIIHKHSSNIDVHQAYDGREALNIIETFKKEKNFPDLILLDLAMPVMDGFEFLEHLSKQTNPTQANVMILTSIDHPEEIKKTMKYNFVKGCFTKPLTPHNLDSICDMI